MTCVVTSSAISTTYNARNVIFLDINADFASSCIYSYRQEDCLKEVNTSVFMKIE